MTKPTATSRPTEEHLSGSWLVSKNLVGLDGFIIWLTRIRDGKKCVRITKQDDKMNMCKWDGRVSHNTFALFLDFDAVPSFLVDRLSVSTSMDMNAFADYLRHEYPGECIFRSAGGNVKMMVLFSDCTRNEALAELEATFTELWPYCDKSGLTHTIVPFDAVDTINDFIHTRDARNGHDVEETVWKMSTNPLVIAASKDFFYGHKRHLLTLFILSARLTGPVIALPITLMADTCGCSTSTVKAFIDKAVEAGFIECIDSYYAPGHKSRLYRILCDWWLKIMGLTWKPEQKGIKSVDTSMFTDGNWFTALWNHTRLFNNGIEFMLFVHSLDGVYRPGKYRLAKARSAWRSHAKRNGLSMEVC